MIALILGLREANFDGPGRVTVRVFLIEHINGPYGSVLGLVFDETLPS